VGEPMASGEWEFLSKKETPYPQIRPSFHPLVDKGKTSRYLASLGLL
jgi:hypothetical protein